MYVQRTGTLELPDIPGDYVQTYQVTVKLRISKEQLSKRIALGYINKDIDLDIVKFVYKFQVVSLEQVAKFLNLKGYDMSLDIVEKKLESLHRYSLIKKFTLADDTNERFAPDSFALYCLDVGGQFFLSQFTNDESVDSWESFYSVKSTDHIIKNLQTTQFYLRLLESCPSKLEFFDVRPKLPTDSRGIQVVSPSFVFCLKSQDETSKSYYMGEVVNETDNLAIQQKLSNLQKCIQTNWTSYYGNVEPQKTILFVISTLDKSTNKNYGATLLAEDIDKTKIRNQTDLEFMNHLTAIIKSCVNLEFRITNESILNNPDIKLYTPGVFYRYNDTKKALVKVRIKIFENE